MKKIYFLLLLLPLLAACSRNIHSDMVTGTDFNKYRTYAWVMPEEDQKPKSILNGNIHNAANREMYSRGFKGDSINPDLLLSYEVKVNKRRSIAMNPVYGWGMSPWWGGWGSYWGPRSYWGMGMMGYQTYPVYYQDATITINAIDQKTNKLVWTGTYADVVDSRTFKGKTISKTVNKIFKKFPLREIRS